MTKDEKQKLATFARIRPQSQSDSDKLVQELYNYVEALIAERGRKAVKLDRVMCLNCLHVYNTEVQYKGHLGAKKNSGCKYAIYPIKMHGIAMRGDKVTCIARGNAVYIDRAIEVSRLDTLRQLRSDKVSEGKNE